MWAAFEAGEKCGATLVLGDILLDIQVLRLLGAFSVDQDLTSKFKKWSEIGKTRKVSVKELHEDLRCLGWIPAHERDMFMSTTLLEAARKCKTVVAIVGWEHLKGIKEHWKNLINVDKLLAIPSRRSTELVVETLKLKYYVGNKPRTDASF